MPKVSIVLPTYNRARFLGSALASIGSQTLENWELIVVDDGGTDRSQEIVEAFARECRQKVAYLKQPNRGPAAARNVGIRAARGEFIAFYDSDDIWTGTHLERCAGALDANPDVHWVYGSFSRSRLASGEVIEPDIFCPKGRPAAFLFLKASRRGDLYVIRDPKVLQCAVAHGIGIGLKVSVARRAVFDGLAIPDFRVGEDQALIPRALARGVRFGYLKEIHGTAYIHDENISTVAGSAELEKSIRVHGELVRALQSLRDLPLTFAERKALDHRIAREKFWHLGYPCWTARHTRDALEFMREGLSLHPTNFSYWKTYLLALARRNTRVT